VLSRRRPDEQVFEKKALLAKPGGIVVKEERESGGLAGEVGDQNFRGGARAKQRFDEILLGDRCFPG
jgi:hypothetical protein